MISRSLAGLGCGLQQLAFILHAPLRPAHDIQIQHRNAVQNRSQKQCKEGGDDVELERLPDAVGSRRFTLSCFEMRYCSAAGQGLKMFRIAFAAIQP